MKFIGFILLYCCIAMGVKAQTEPVFPKQGKNDTIRVYATNVDGQMIPWIVTEEVKIVDTRIFKSQADKDAYNRLRYNVYKVIPYAHFAGSRYRQLQRDLALTADKKKQKLLVAACETQIKDLIKLIDRETNNTSYDVVRELKGGFNAFLLQSAARIFGHNLKETYDRDEQRDIEQILQQAGYDSYKYE
jgi:hypothetical protein